MKKQKENSHEGITWSEMGKQNVQAEKVYYLWVNVFCVTLLSDVENTRCPPNLSTMKRRLKIAIALIVIIVIIEILH